MTEDESTRAHDIGDMFAVLPSIESRREVVDAYRDSPPAPVGAYRSDGVAAMARAEVEALVRETFAAAGAFG